ncbi:MAG: family transcriptional regulator, regulator of embCAB operon [Mycobacterium sp.]|jgi:DNA-binding SARP family transcriptional activator|nr:family transcriptional regulator, regulator of embCAB operon [Mycobacterium sp.]
MAEKGAEFGVLGPLQVWVDGAPVPLGTPKQRAVLAMLLINRNRPVATDALIEAAWEQFPPPEPHASLHSYVSNIRKLLGRIGVDSRTALASAPPGYRLSVPENGCDIGRFALGKCDGDRIRICDHQFVLEVQPPEV